MSEPDNWNRFNSVRSTKRQFLKLAAGAGIAGSSLFMPGIIGARAQSNKSAVMVLPSPPGINYITEIYSRSSGAFAANGLDVTLEVSNGTAQAMQQVLAGSALLTRVTVPELANAIVNRDAPVVTVAPVDQRSNLFFISHRDRPISSAEDIRGKKFGITARGGATESELKLLLGYWGVPLSEVETPIVGLSASSFELVKSGQIDGFVTSTGARAQLEISGEPYHAFRLNDFVPFIGHVYIANRDTFDANKDAISTYIKTVRETAQKVISDTDGVFGELTEADMPDMARPQVSRLTLDLTMSNWQVAGPDYIFRHNAERWDDSLKVLVDAGVIQSGNPAEWRVDV